MKKVFVLFSFIFLSIFGYSQPSTPYAPNVIVHDIDGVEHNLYTYLNQGRNVVLEFYKSNSVASINSRPGVNDLYNMYGLGGDLSHAIISIDMDSLTSTEATFKATHSIPNAVVDSIQNFKDYNVGDQPMFIIICPDRLWKVRFGSIFDDESYITSMSDQCAPLSTFDNDGKIFKFFGNPQYCQGETTAHLYIQNYSKTNNLTWAYIEAREANILRGSKIWEGNLKPYEIDTVEIELSGISGFDFIDFELKSVNQMNDNFHNNNTFTQILREGEIAGHKLKVEFFTDYHPEQNEWYVIELETGDTVLHSFNNNFQPNQFYSIDQTLQFYSDGCYELFLEDSFGDGILTGTTPDGPAQGRFTVTTNLGDTIMNISHFENLTSRKFYMEKTLSNEEFEFSNPELIINPENNNFQITGLNEDNNTIVTVFDLQGKLLYQQKETTQNLLIPANKWAKGIYIVKLNNGDQQYTLKAIR